MNDCTAYGVTRFGDDVAFEIQDGILLIRGRHLAGDRYELRFPLADLRPERQVFWIRDSRPGVQLGLFAIFLMLVGVAVAAGILLPRDLVVRLAPWTLGILFTS